MELEKINEIAKEIFGETVSVIKTAEMGDFIDLALINKDLTICTMKSRKTLNIIFHLHFNNEVLLANASTLRQLADFIERVEEE